MCGIVIAENRAENYNNFAEVLLEDKANLVQQLQEERYKVCFVGDGINDSIALKSANVAISLPGATTIATDMPRLPLWLKPMLDERKGQEKLLT